jgi:TatD DNase family protein
VTLTDTHCHLTLAEFDADRDMVVNRARAVGITRLVVVGIDAASGEQAIRLVEQYPELSAAVGMHPHEADRLDGAEKGRLKELAKHPRVVAIGEMGLDYYRTIAPPEAQVSAFRWQLELAQGAGLPIIVHSREASAETVAILREYLHDGRMRGVMHCFSGDERVLEQVLELGMYLSLGGPVTYPTARGAATTARSVPLDRLLLETDCPYLPPQPYRGKRNEPAYLVTIAQRIAEIRGITTAELAQATSDNASALFGLARATFTTSIASGGQIE